MDNGQTWYAVILVGITVTYITVQIALRKPAEWRTGISVLALTIWALLTYIVMFADLNYDINRCMEYLPAAIFALLSLLSGHIGGSHISDRHCDDPEVVVGNRFIFLAAVLALCVILRAIPYPR